MISNIFSNFFSKIDDLIIDSINLFIKKKKLDILIISDILKIFLRVLLLYEFCSIVLFYL